MVKITNNHIFKPIFFEPFLGLFSAHKITIYIYRDLPFLSFPYRDYNFLSWKNYQI